MVYVNLNLRSIDGEVSTLLVPVTVEGLPENFDTCFSEEIVPQGGAFDVVYRIGSLKRNKFLIPEVVNSYKVSCQRLLRFNASLTNG